jgi:hypothetical protein
VGRTHITATHGSHWTGTDSSRLVLYGVVLSWSGQKHIPEISVIIIIVVVIIIIIIIVIIIIIIVS